MAGTARTVTALAGAERTLDAAVDAFLAQPRPATTARTYTRTLERLAGELGRDRPLTGITDGELADAASALWGGLAPRTWNRHLATTGSFLAWCRRHGWPAGNLALRADRRAAAEDDTRAIPLPELERLWARTGYPAAGAGAVAAAVRLRRPRRGSPRPRRRDLDLANRQARARTKGGHPGRCTSRPPPPGCWPG